MKNWKVNLYWIVLHAALFVSAYVNLEGGKALRECLYSTTEVEYKAELRHAIERYIERNTTQGTAAAYSAMYIEAGREFNLDPMLLAVVGKFESGFNPEAISHTGAIGVQQIMPFWVKAIPFLNAQEDLYNPELNIKASAYILSHYRELCGNNVASMSACYHGGPAAKLNPKESTQKFKAAVSYAYYTIKANTSFDSSI